MSSRGKKKKIRNLERQSSLENIFVPDYINFESPFKNIPQDKLHDFMKEVGEKSDKEFNIALDELKDYLRHFDVNLITWFSYYTLSGAIPDTAEAREENKIVQFHVELLQALFLQNDYSDENVEWKPVIPESIAEVEKLLFKMIGAYTFRKLKDFTKYNSEEEKKKISYIDSMRNHTMAVRNWGYPEQVIRITKEVFSKIDIEIFNKFGISAVSLIEMFERIVKIIEERHNNHVSKVREFLKCNDKTEIIAIYKKNWPEVKSTNEELLNISRNFATRNEFKNYLLCHSDMFIRDIFTFNIDEIRREYPDVIDREKLSNILDCFAFSYGELHEYNSEHFFLGNPIWTKPLIKCDKELYIWPIPGLLFHSCFDLIEQIFASDSQLTEKYEKSRAKFLEEAIENEFIKGYPQAKVFRGSNWTDDIENKNYENDLLILIDSYAIAVEAKSGKITDPAKRGAPERLKRDIEKLIVEPSIQACRFSRYLDRYAGKIITLKDGMGNDIQVDLTNIRKVLTYSITLDLFGPMGTNLLEIYKAGFIKEKDDLSPCMTLADLEIITELLDTSCEKIHYFSRRFELEKNAKFMADELDLLVFYLETGFNIGESEIDGIELMLYGVSSKLDYYYLNRYHNPHYTGLMPQPRRTKWWDSIINKLEERKIPRWTEISYILLSVSFEDQQKIERMFLEVVEVVKKEWNIKRHKNSVVLFNGYKRNDVVIIYAYKNLDKKTRNDNIENIVYQSFDEEDRCNRALVIGIDIDETHYPYNVLAVIDRINL